MARSVRSPYDEDKDWLDNSRAGAAALAGIAPLHQATVTLDNDQIIHSPTTAIDIVTAPGAGKLLLPQATVLFAHTVTPYGNVATDDNGQIRLYYADVDYASLPAATGDGGFSLNQVFIDGSLTFFGPMFTPGTVGAGDVARSYAEMWLEAFSVRNKPLTLTVYNAGGDFTGGNAANTLTVSVAYYILNTITGEFE